MRGGVFRGLAAVVAAALVAGAMAIAPATGASPPLTKRRALKLFHRKSRVYTKAQADQRFRIPSRGVLRSPNPTENLGPAFQGVIGLAALHDGGGDERVVVSVPSRIMASASVGLSNGPGPTASRAFCKPILVDAAGATQDMSAQIGASTPAIANYGVAVPVEGTAVAQPGTFDVRVECFENFGDILFYRASLNVVVIPI